MRCFFSLSSVSVAAPTWMTATPPDSFASRSCSFSRSKSLSVSSILPLDHLDAALDGVRLAGAVDDRGLFLGDLDRLGVTEQLRRDLVEFEAELFGDHRRAGEGRDVLEHLLAAIAEARRLDRDGRERSAQLVDDQRRERFTFDVFGDDEQRLLHLHDLLEQRQDVGDRRDLALGDEDVRIGQRASIRSESVTMYGEM